LLSDAAAVADQKTDKKIDEKTDKKIEEKPSRLSVVILRDQPFLIRDGWFFIVWDLFYVCY